MFNIYKCPDCGLIFSEPKRVYEEFEYRGYSASTPTDVCPLCYGVGWDEFNPEEELEEEYIYESEQNNS